MWKTLRGRGFVYANGNGHGEQSSGRCSRAHRCRGRCSRRHGSVAAAGRCPAAWGHAALRPVRLAAAKTMRADAGIGPYGVTMPFPVGRGALTPPPGRHPPCGAPVGVGVPDDPCPLPAGKNRLGNDTHPTNSISVYSVLPFKNASAGMVA